MYTLRIIEAERELGDPGFNKVVENFELGCAYTVLEKGETIEFDKVISDRYQFKDKSLVNAIICGDNGKEFFVETDNINRKYQYFIMTDSGQTFERL